VAAALRICLAFAGDASIPRYSDEAFLVLTAVEFPDGLRPYGVLTYPGGPVVLLTVAACAAAFLLAHLGEFLAALFTLDLGRLLDLYELHFLEHYAGSARNWVAARLVAAAGGVATVGCLARFGRRWAGEGAGLAGAALLAVWPAHVLLSAQARIDVWVGLFLVLLLDEAFAVAADGDRSVWPLALWSALLATTKNNAAVVFPVVLYLLWRGSPAGTRWRRLGRWAGWTALFAVVACPWLLSDPVFVAKEMVRTYWALPGVALTIGWQSGRLAGLGSALWHAFGPVLLIAGAAGAVLWARRRPLALTASLWTLFFTTLSMFTAGIFFGHYLVSPAVPLLAGAGLLAVEGGRGAARLARLPVRVGAPVAAAVLCLLLLPGLAGTMMRGAAPERAQARDWIESHVPEAEAILAQSELGLLPDRSSLVRELEWLERRYFREATPLPVPLATELFAMEVQYRIHALRHLLRAEERGLLEGKQRHGLVRFEWGFVPEEALEALRGGEVSWVVTSRGKREAVQRGFEAGLDSGGADEVIRRALEGRKEAEFGRGAGTLEIYRLRPEAAD